MKKTLQIIAIVLIIIWAVLGILYTAHKLGDLYEKRTFDTQEQVIEAPKTVAIAQASTVTTPKPIASSTFEAHNDLIKELNASLGPKHTITRCMQYQNDHVMHRDGFCGGNIYSNDYINWLNENF